MRISVGQFRPTGVAAENVATMERLAGQARDDGAELILFPEESMFTVRHVAGSFAESVDAGWSSFVRDLTRIAADLQIAIVARDTRRADRLRVALERASTPR